ncbi:SET and MYND domain-containing protein 4-like [Liolophura sinensis]|uniref:SET and MYND domain-containing protein 4-like n=1 Tax=Liolophura sinensis TaxID=3198878 RepID=UPI0031598458
MLQHGYSISINVREIRVQQISISRQIKCHVASDNVRVYSYLAVREATMCNTQLGNWQDAIDKIWHAAAENGDLATFSKCSNDVQRIKFVTRKQLLRSVDWLQAYLDNCSDVQMKSAEKAKCLRNEGNKHFQKKSFKKALDLYTRSILHSPEGPHTELALGYGNRSAVFYHLDRYTDCICDVEVALKCGFPENTQYKLYQRWGQCLYRLGKIKCAREKFLQALKGLNSQTDADLKRKGEIDEWLLKTESCEDVPCVTGDIPELSAPGVSYGTSSVLPKASAAVSLQYSSTKGRHLVAERDISEGDTLIVERPYAAVLLPDHYNTHCHHCFIKLSNTYPCCQCTKVHFCSPQCREAAWSVYHQYECLYLDILHSVGIAHLSVRVVLTTNLQSVRDLRAQLSALDGPQQGIDGVNKAGLYDTDYWSVFHLMPHTDDMVTDDLLQYTLTAALLAEILLKSKFVEIQPQTVDDREDSSKSPDAPLPKRDKVNCMVKKRLENGITGEEFDFISGLLLRHIQQLVCNAHAITELQASEVSNSDSVEAHTQVRVATAIYPTASLMNHSCDPTIISSFHRDTLVVRSVKAVPKGREIFNCYGPHCKRMCRTERQEALKGQYYFTCTCEACEMGEYKDRIFQAFRCVKCDGPVCVDGEQLQCRSCDHQSEVTKHVDAITKSQGLFVEGLRLLENGDIKGARSKLESCSDIQRKVLYKHNRDLAQTQDCLARCWAMLGNLDKSALFLEESLETTKLVYGEKSVEVGNELSKLAGIFFNNHQVAKAMPIINQSIDILQMHYGENHSSLFELTEMKNCLMQLKN